MARFRFNQSQILPGPPELPFGFYLYGKKRATSGYPCKWIDQLFQDPNYPIMSNEPETKNSSLDESIPVLEGLNESEDVIEENTDDSADLLSHNTKD